MAYNKKEFLKRTNLSVELEETQISQSAKTSDGVLIGFEIKRFSNYLEIITFTSGLNDKFTMPFRIYATIDEDEVILRQVFDNGVSVDVEDEDVVNRVIGKVSLIIDYVASLTASSCLQAASTMSQKYAA